MSNTLPSRRILSRFAPVAALAMAAALGLGVALPAREAIAAPEPSLTPVRWQLDIDPGPLRLTTVNVEGVGPRAFYTMTYRVTNNSGQDLYFAPAFELAVDEESPIRSGRGVATATTREILAKHGNGRMLDQVSVIGMLRQGPENSRDGLVIWPADRLRANEVTVYAIGFSGETRRIAKPDAKAADGKAASSGQRAKAGARNPGEVVLRKTLMITHQAPGDLTGLGDAVIERTGERWILR